MSHLKVLVTEGLAIDGLASSAIAACKVTSLAHEARNDAMEGAALCGDAQQGGDTVSVLCVCGCVWRQQYTHSTL